MFRRIDKKYRFVTVFDPEKGFYLRSGVFNSQGKETEQDPFMASFPHLLDVGIMGHCAHGKSGLCLASGVQCYQNGLSNYQPNMKLDDFKKIVDECKGKTFQFALGGRGDPDQHENFEEILKYCKENYIIPNFTSSGLGFNERIVQLCKKYCGAVAISYYGTEYTDRAIKMLVDAKVRTNIHYVLSNSSIDRAIDMLKNDKFPSGIEAVIFLLHKPVGLGTSDNVLKYDDPRVREFFKLIDDMKFKFAIGFDSCSIPGILNFTEKIMESSLDTCEGARFSMYVTSDMKALPCSFDNQDLKWAYDISNDTILNAWNSDVFESFRKSLRTRCPNCNKREQCMGGCPIKSEIVLCNKNCKTLE